MTCKRWQKMMVDNLASNLSPLKQRILNEHLAICPHCRKIMNSMKTMWEKVESLPEQNPSPSMLQRFNTMLAHEKEKSTLIENRLTIRDRFNGWIEHWFPKKPIFQTSLAMACLLIGLIIGRWSVISGILSSDVINLQNELKTMKQTAYLNLLEQPSAGDRLRGVGLCTNISEPDNDLFQKLLEHVKTDPNTNVRLAAVDALYLFSNHTGFSDTLLTVLEVQTSPLVQVAVVDLLISIRERRAIQALKTIINTQKVNAEVRQHASKKLQEII